MSVTSPGYLIQDLIADPDGIASAQISVDEQATWLSLTFNPLTGYWERAITLIPGDNVIWHRATDAHPTSPQTTTPVSTTVNYLTPNTVALVASIEPSQARARLVFTTNDTGADYVTITRHHPSGRTATVRGANRAALSGGQLIVWDYELPIGLAVYYTANTYRGTITAARNTAIGNEVTWQSASDYLKDPLEPIRNITATVQDMDEYDYPTRTGVHDVLGRPTPLTVGEIRQSARGDLVLTTETMDERDRLHFLTSSGHALLLQSSQRSGVGNMYIALLDVKEQRLGKRDQADRRWILSYLEVDAPAGDSPSTTVTYADILQTYSNFTEILAANNSYLDLIENLAHTAEPPTLAWRGA